MSAAVKALADELRASQERVKELEAAIRKHRDERGDDRCWMDDEALYAVLPEGHTPPARDTAVELANCERFIRCRRSPATEYVSPQRRIEELKAGYVKVGNLMGVLANLDAMSLALLKILKGTCCPDCMEPLLAKYRSVMAGFCELMGKSYEELHNGESCP